MNVWWLDLKLCLILVKMCLSGWMYARYIHFPECKIERWRDGYIESDFLVWPPRGSLQPLWTVAGQGRKDVRLISTHCKGNLGLVAGLSHHNSWISATQKFFCIWMTEPNLKIEPNLGNPLPDGDPSVNSANVGNGVNPALGVTSNYISYWDDSLVIFPKITQWHSIWLWDAGTEWWCYREECLKCHFTMLWSDSKYV